MAQLINVNSTEFRRCNLSAIQSGGTWASIVPDANEIILISTANALTAGGSGECDAYIIGDGTTTASALSVVLLVDNELNAESAKPLKNSVVTKELQGETMFSGSHNYTGAANWRITNFFVTAGEKYLIRVNSPYTISVATQVTVGYATLATFNDNSWHEVTIPDDVLPNRGLMFSYNGTESFTAEAEIVRSTFYADVNNRFEEIESSTNAQLAEMQEQLDEEISTTIETIGEGFGTQNFNNNVIYCCCKTSSEDGVLDEVYLYAGADTTATLYIGEVDQNLLLIPRITQTIPVVSGANTIDMTSYGIYVYKGESVAFKTTTGGIRFNNGTAGDPTAENSFRYSVNATNLFQLQNYTVQKIFKVGFYAKIKTSNNIKLQIEDERIEKNMSAMGDTISSISSQMGIVSDNQGNKYRLMVVNGQLQAIAMQYHHVLVVGNSFTTHPTTTDTGTGFTTSVWWGHWAMAASTGDVAWTKLLQNGLQAENAGAVVTPIFGRPYETGLYAVNANDAFVYWQGTTRKSLKANLSSFADVDCVIFFLGDNYTGSEWASMYETMYNQFATWFPTAQIICMSTITKTDVNADIQSVANAKGATYVDVYGIKTLAYRSTLGNFVKGDDGLLHQIDNSSVGGHFGDNGQYLLATKASPAIGISIADVPHRVTLNSSTLTMNQFDYLNGSVVSVFADASVSTISVVDSQAVSIDTELHANTPYGNIFTFTMPNSDVVITAS